MRILSFLLLGALGFLVPWWLFGIGAGLYAFRYTAFELIALGILLDVSFGISTFTFLPFPCVYTTLLCVVLFVRVFGKPRLSFS